MHWIDKEKLKTFILDCQDKERGGISDRPDNAVDVFHTFFGIAGPEFFMPYYSVIFNNGHTKMYTIEWKF